MNTPNHSPPPKTLKIESNFGPRRKRTSQDLFLSLMDSKTFSIENSCSATFFHKHRSPRIRAISFVIRIFPFRCQHASYREGKKHGFGKDQGIWSWETPPFLKNPGKTGGEGFPDPNFSGPRFWTPKLTTF